jgi:stearoyl-CoA desaturase (delta-9 desaturase)
MIKYIKKTYTPQLTLIVVPYFLLTIVLSFLSSVNWWLVFIFLFLIGIIGNGVVGHRLIAHRQFKSASWLKPLLFLTCTLAAFAPVWYWRVQHWHHHKFSDQESDIHSPSVRSLWDSFFGWALKQDYVRTVIRTEKASLRESLNDPLMKFFHEYNYLIIWIFIVTISIISLDLLFSYLIFYWIEIIRLGLITSVAHIESPGSYRNFNTPDKSFNNIFLGYLTFGFGWHNNHHANPMALDTQIRWWDYDFDAIIAKLIQFIPGKR